MTKSTEKVNFMRLMVEFFRDNGLKVKEQVKEKFG